MTLEDLYLGIPDGIDIDYYIFNNCESLSAPIGERYIIAIDPTKIKSQADEKEKVAHELEHCLSGSFYSPSTDYITRRQCEVKSEHRTFKRLMPLGELRQAVASGISEKWQLAEHFGVSEQFVANAVEYYRQNNPDFMRFSV